MIIKKVWLEAFGAREWERQGWFLLGIIPLYIRDMNPRRRKLN